MGSCRNLGREMVVVTTDMKLGLEAMRSKDLEIPPTRPYKYYSMKAKPGSYVAKLLKGQKVEQKTFE